MRVENNTYLKTNITGAKQFTLKVDGSAFKVLSRDIYTNPKLAVIRELACNAYDSHVAAGKTDVPFEVYLPTATSSDLVVKDFGVGMSPEDLENLYSTYFESNKTHTNDLVGGFGVGSKSPFAISDQFTVITRWYGQAHTYSCFLNEKGIPSLTKVHSVLTDDCNGLEVIVSTSHDFYQELPCLQWFETPPKVIGGTVPTPDWQYKCAEYGILNDTNYYVIDKVLMGNVLYSTTCRALPKSFGGQLVLFAPIGKYKMQVSREALSEDNETLHDDLKSAARQYREYVNAHILTLLSPWEQFKFYRINKALINDDHYQQDYLKHFEFGFQPPKKKTLTWTKWSERHLFEGMLTAKFMWAKPRTSYIRVREEHFDSTLILIKLRTNEKMEDWFPEVLDPSDYKLAPTGRRTGNNAYEGIFVNESKIDYQEARKLKLPVQFYVKHHYSKPGFYSTSLLINEGYEVMFVPNTKMLKQRFRNHETFDDFADRELRIKYPILTKYEFNSPVFDYTVTGIKFNRAVREFTKVKEYTDKMQQLQSMLINQHGLPIYSNRQLVSLYWRTYNRYPMIKYLNPTQTRDYAAGVDGRPTKRITENIK